MNNMSSQDSLFPSPTLNLPNPPATISTPVIMRRWPPHAPPQP